MKNIKYIFSTVLFLVLFATISFSQIDRSVKPQPGPAPEIKIGDYQSFTLENGLKVIVVENHKVPVVSYQLTIDVDPVMQENAVGYLGITGELLRKGTKNSTKQQLDEQIDFMGATLNTYENGIFASSLKKHSDKLLSIMSDVLINPVFPEDELEKAKKQSISGLTASETDPNSIADRVAKKLVYGAHPYSEIITKESIANITRNLCLNYYNTYYKPNVSYLVIVGDITIDESKVLAKKYFGSWQKGVVPKHEYKFPEKNIGTRIALIDKDDAVQSVIKVTYPVNLKPGSADNFSARLANEILGGGIFSGRLMQNLREDKGYTYGAYSSLNPDQLIGSFEAGAEVRTSVTDSAITEFLFEMNRMRNEQVEGEDLQLTKNVATGSFARSLERPQTIASFALNTARYKLDKNYYSSYLEKLNAVSAADVQKASQKFITPDNAIIVVVGDKDYLFEKLKPFSPKGIVELYDFNGNPVKEEQKVFVQITAEEVIAKYIDALGGKENLEKIESFVKKANTSMSGMTINLVTYKKAPNKFAMEMYMNKNMMQKQSFNGEKGKIKGFQGEKEITGEDLEELKISAVFNQELKYNELGIKLSLDGVEKIEGEDAFKVIVLMPNGKKTIDFYSLATGLKIQSRETIVTPQGEFVQTQSFSDYREVNGIKFPFLIKASGIQNMELITESVEINIEIKDEIFN
ncbi:MAG: pitrilysin family protein [Bacteroidales bacterium]|jgi:predicted Zn-dependent peptidase|nr:pitrilysin family protein [Bacteroidales bacterium]